MITCTTFTVLLQLTEVTLLLYVINPAILARDAAGQTRLLHCRDDNIEKAETLNYES